MGDLLMCFNCCVTEQPRPAKRRRRLDPSMIGLPQDFRHTGHIGSSDATNGTYISSIQTQMKSKGGYSNVSPVNIELDVIDLDVQKPSSNGT
ncbi:CDC42 small effector protein 2-like [Liolophura sinensis]|uniref:CDC42 small effector protein 2-like n=1 Tax=Liolophura sinensis TaxID=3198878 RepID=UPI00315829F4